MKMRDNKNKKKPYKTQVARVPKPILKNLEKLYPDKTNPERFEEAFKISLASLELSTRKLWGLGTETNKKKKKYKRNRRDLI